jgi:hypothetical protein
MAAITGADTEVPLHLIKLIIMIITIIMVIIKNNDL